jgi:guanylate kinase
VSKTGSKPGLLLIISGPSGVGKTTITHHVERELGGVFSVSLTTRTKAAGDREGVDYHFVSQAEFDRAKDAGELLEWAEVYAGCSYGTPRKPVEDALTAGRLMILEIDVDGALQVTQKMPEAFSIFVLPPNENVLLERLRTRKRDDESVILRRFAKAKREIIKAWDSGIYNEFVVNRDLDHAVQEAVELVRKRMSAASAGKHR